MLDDALGHPWAHGVFHVYSDPRGLPRHNDTSVLHRAPMGHVAGCLLRNFLLVCPATLLSSKGRPPWQCTSFGDHHRKSKGRLTSNI